MAASKGWWIVEIGYVGSDREFKWGQFRTPQRGEARKVWAKYLERGERPRLRLLKGEVLVCEVGPEVFRVEDEKGFAGFYNGGG